MGTSGRVERKCHEKSVLLTVQVLSFTVLVIAVHSSSVGWWLDPCLTSYSCKESKECAGEAPCPTIRQIACFHSLPLKMETPSDNCCICSSKELLILSNSVPHFLPQCIGRETGPIWMKYSDCSCPGTVVTRLPDSQTPRDHRLPDGVLSIHQATLPPILSL